ncbi:hypothetical protein NDU88_001573 [Pleurodeles waltl]|uniref:Uncharacterized protein n=1 Tax=Pleurodeles waltl TaxID=8319 RepID=A0AAV7Q492_PLEWA|nr:hypothetical protein NDU88_001573 [Pleurodeles waltl]
MRVDRPIPCNEGKTPVGLRAFREARNRNGTARRGRAVPLPKVKLPLHRVLRAASRPSVVRRALESQY